MLQLNTFRSILLQFILTFVAANDNQLSHGIINKSRKILQSSDRVSMFYTFGLPNGNCSSTDTQELDIRFLMSQWNTALVCRRCSALYELSSCMPYPNIKYEMYNRGIDTEHIQKAINTFVLNPVCILQFFSRYGIVQANVLKPLHQDLSLPSENVRFEQYDPEQYPLLPNCNISAGSIPAQVNPSRVTYFGQDDPDNLISASAEFDDQGEAVVVPFAELVEEYLQPPLSENLENLDTSPQFEKLFVPNPENDDENSSISTEQSSQKESSQKQSVLQPQVEIDSSMEDVSDFPILQGSREYFNDDTFSAPTQESQFENSYSDFPILQGSRENFNDETYSPLQESQFENSDSDFPGTRKYFPQDTSPVMEDSQDLAAVDYSDFPVLQGTREFFAQDTSPVTEDLQDLAAEDYGNSQSGGQPQVRAFAASTPTDISNFPVLQASLQQYQQGVDGLVPVPGVESTHVENSFMIYTRCFKENLSEQDAQICANLTDQVMQNINNRRQDSSVQNAEASQIEKSQQLPTSANEVRLESANVQNADSELTSSSTSSDGGDTKDRFNTGLWIGFVSMIGLIILVLIVLAVLYVAKKKQQQQNQ